MLDHYDCIEMLSLFLCALVRPIVSTHLAGVRAGSLDVSCRGATTYRRCLSLQRVHPAENRGLPSTVRCQTASCHHLQHGQWVLMQRLLDVRTSIRVQQLTSMATIHVVRVTHQIPVELLGFNHNITTLLHFLNQLAGFEISNGLVDYE